MTDETTGQRRDDRAPDEPGGDNTLPNAGRRRLAKAGLATPFIMTLTSRPVWAEPACGSLTGSQIASRVSMCDFGCTPGFWCGPASDAWAWRSSGFYRDTRFSDAFGRNPKNDGDEKSGRVFLVSDGEAEATLNDLICRGNKVEVVEPEDCSGNCEALLRQLGMQAVAALLNASVDPPPNTQFAFTAQQVIGGFWTAYNSGSASTIETQKDHFDSVNNMGCVLGPDEDNHNGSHVM